MALTSEFVPLELSELRREAAVLKADGWRFIETHAAMGEDGVDLYYAFMKNGHAVNYCVRGIKKDQPVPSITDLFLAAFVFENEARELFGVDMRDIAIDFKGAMYAPAQAEPMTFITPEQKAAKEKAAKAAAAKAAKEAQAQTAGGEQASAAPASGKRVFVMTPELQARLDKKLANMSPEKVAKVEAALAARKAEAEAAASAPQATEAAAQPAAEAKPAPSAAEAKPAAAAVEASAAPKKDTVLEDTIAALDPAKAAKVRAALGMSTSDSQQESAAPSAANEQAGCAADAEVEQVLQHMDDAKAAKIRAALAR